METTQTIKTLRGTITRSTGGAIYFHLGEPYSKTTTVIDSRDPKHPRTEKTWFSDFDSIMIDFDPEGKLYPNLTVDTPVNNCEISIFMPL